MAIKLLISAQENSGKSTLGAKVQDAFVVNFDRKEYGFAVPHTNIPTYTEHEDVVNTINSKLALYQERFKKLPATIVIDTVTQLYTAIQNKNGKRYKGFDVHSNNSKDTLSFNDYVEDVLIANGVNVVIIAHTTYDPETSRYIIPASGQFAKAGSWMSVVNDAIFIEKKSNKLIVHQTSMKFPCRTTQTDLEPAVDMDAFDINKYISVLVASKVESTEFVF